jgi:SAM-dependent methyltransferase
VQGTLEGLPLRDASVDALFCFSVFQYVDRQRALDECARVLKPGAPFAFVENLADHPVAMIHRVLRHRNSGPRRTWVVRSYPSWADVQASDPRFAEWVSHPFALLAPIALVWPGAERWPADLAARAWPRVLIETLHGWDRCGFSKWSRARDWAWLALTLGRR